MTAYASVYKHQDSQAIQIILRSLNFKYLDVLIRNLPPEDILLEAKIKAEIKKKLYRGKVEAFIFITKPSARRVHIDEKLVSRYISSAKTLARRHHLKPEIKISDILGLPQAIFWEQKAKNDETIIFPVLKEALKRLVEFKNKEGAAIQREILSNLGKLKADIEKIRRLKPRIDRMEIGKEDIDEELALISFYIAKLGEKVKAKKLIPKGKAIDFLTQEILRELNAASSKTRKRKAALLIVEAKNYLERIREQTQNVE